MKLLKMPFNDHNCLTYSLAMIVNREPEELIELIGHNGQDIWWTGFTIPYCYRGIHIQEIIDVCIKIGHYLTPIEYDPKISPWGEQELAKSILVENDRKTRFRNHIKNNDSILIGRYKGRPHAVAWNSDEKLIYDPNGIKYKFDDFSIIEAWMLI